ncbi:hypothetical protein [Herbidospora mongoliensis]|uniref:hypothetical protein n=1 Tax=Herbidospora mongoliensis TaxID=688067 RepID=UPI0008339E83|nr:hypothetical protein [Herbidospora mongoliensis]
MSPTYRPKHERYKFTNDPSLGIRYDPGSCPSPLTGIEGGVTPLTENRPVPSLWTVAETDFGANATALFEKIPQTTKGRLKILPVGDHSLGLLRRHPEAMTFVEDALRTC